MANTDISLEPLLNRSQIGTGINTKLAVVTTNSLGTCTHRATAVSVTDTAQQISLTAGYRSLYIYNNGNNPVYIGGSGVTSAIGLPILDGQHFIFNGVSDSFNFYIVSGTGLTNEVRIVEFT